MNPENEENLNQLEFEVRMATFDALAKAGKICSRVFEVKDVTLDLKGQCAGQVRYATRTFRQSLPTIRFNPVLLAENKPAFLNEVVPHEVAHVVAYQLYGFNIKPHGPEWQSVMREIFGLEPRATHRFDTPNSNRVTFPYTCECPGMTHNMGKIRHNRVVRKQARYLCNQCGTALVAVDENEILV